MPEEFFPPLYTHPRDIGEDRGNGPLAPQLLVMGNGKAVRLVPDPGEEEQRRRILPEDYRIFSSRQEDPLIAPLDLLSGHIPHHPALGKGRRRNPFNPQLRQYPGQDLQLADPAVHDDEVRPVIPLRTVAKAACQDFMHHGEVVRLRHGPDPVAAIEVFVRPAVPEDDPAADGEFSADVGDVIALDAAGKSRKMEPFPQLPQRCFGARGGRLLFLGCGNGVPVRQADQLGFDPPPGER